MKFGFSLILLCMGLNISAKAAPVCRNVYSPRPALAPKKIEKAPNKILAEKPVKKDFWSQNIVELEFPSGKKPITYSLDSELNIADAFRYMMKNPQALKDLRKSFANENYWITEIARIAGMTESQFRTFGLRHGVSKTENSYNVTDLNPEAFHAVIDYNVHEATILIEMSRAMDNMFKAEGIPMEAGIDRKNIEVRHDSSEPNPQVFKKLVEALHARVKLPMTHLHLGIASEVSDLKVAEIARAVEADAILDIAKDAAVQSQELPYTDFTTLNTPEPKNTDARGIVRLGYKEFHKPFFAHNLEIRQYGNLKHGFSLVEKASLLAQNHDRLLVTSPRLKELKDPETSNLPGALYHVGTVLKRSKDPNDRAVAQQLLIFSEQIYEEGAITRPMRLKVADFLNQAKPLQRLKIEYYLNP